MGEAPNCRRLLLSTQAFTMIPVLLLLTGCAGLGGTWAGSYDQVAFQLGITDGLFNSFVADLSFDWAGNTYTGTQNGALVDGGIDLSGSAPSDIDPSMAMVYRFNMDIQDDIMTGTCLLQGQADISTFINTGGDDCSLAR